MNDNLSKILKLIGELTQQELMTLNQAVVAQLKNQRDVNFKDAATAFNKGLLVASFPIKQ